MIALLQTNVGPILLCVNPYRDVGNPLTLSSTRGLALSPQLNKVVQEAVRQQSETGYPQAIILSGNDSRNLRRSSSGLVVVVVAVVAAEVTVEHPFGLLFRCSPLFRYQWFGKKSRFYAAVEAAFRCCRWWT